MYTIKNIENFYLTFKSLKYAQSDLTTKVFELTLTKINFSIILIIPDFFNDTCQVSEIDFLLKRHVGSSS